MNPDAKLTEREAQVTELLAWGAAKKEVAWHLQISTRTVEALTRRAYKKIGIQKAAELSSWYFCTKFNISFDLSPLKRGIIGAFLLAVMVPELLQFNPDNSGLRQLRSRRIELRGKNQRREDNSQTFEY